MLKLRTPLLFLSAILFLFFMQLLTDFVAAIYAFGLLGTDIPPELGFVLLFLAASLWLLFQRGPQAGILRLLALVVLLSRVTEPLLDTRWRMLASGLGVAAFLLLLPAWLWLIGQEGKEWKATELGAGLGLALGLEILLRTWGQGVDLSTGGWGQAVGWALALIGGVLLTVKNKAAATPVAAGPQMKREKYITLKVIACSLGLVADVVLLYFSLSAPAVITRWTGGNQAVILAIALLALIAYAYLVTLPPERRINFPVMGWNLLFVLVLAATIYLNQTVFPTIPGAYPLYEAEPSSLASLTLVGVLLLYPVILVNFSLLARELARLRPSIRQLGAGFTLAGLYVILMVFAHVFTTVYDYIPVAGPYFRDQFWGVYLIAGLGSALPVFLLKERKIPLLPKLRGYLWLVVILCAATFLGAGLMANQATPAQSDQPVLRILTYNIQQGYTAEGDEGYRQQLELIQGVDADIIGLQESDTARISGANYDLVGYFANHLGLYNYYGPKTVNGTFGIALLSKYPLKAPSTFYMYSEGEQTAAIHAEVEVNGKDYNIFVTHLGNGGPLIQQENFLEEVKGLGNVIAMGDYNFEPGTPQYQLTLEMLEDAWQLGGSEGSDDLTFNPSERIDHIFVSPGTTVTAARFLTGPESDHPALVIEIAP